MRILFELLVLTLGLGGGAGFLMWKWIKKPPTTADNCKHKRWTKWEVVQTEPVYLYPDPDNGKEIPDRVDSQNKRECIACGLTQYKTVRGIDSVHYK